MQSALKSLKWLQQYERAFLIGLIAPFAALILLLKTLRIMARGTTYGVFHTLDLYRSEVLFCAGFAVFGLAVFSLMKRSSAQRIFLVMLQAVVLFAAFLEISAHRFFISTGSILDFRLSVFAIKQLEEISQVLLSEIPVDIVVVLITSAIVFPILPWVLLFIWSNKQTVKEQNVSLIRPFIKSPQGWSAAAFALSILLIIGSGLPSFGEHHVAFSHASSINLAISAIVDADQNDVSESNRPSLSNIALAARPSQIGKRNVVIVMLESTRASSVSIYNDTHETTPFLKQLASKSLVAERAYAVIPHTSKALVATLCGIEPNVTMAITEATPNGIPTNCLAKLLSKEGYETAFFQSTTESFENARQLTSNMGYETFVPLENMPTGGFEKSNYLGYEDNVMLEPGRQWLKSRKDKPFFATYLTFTPHHPYRAPVRYPHFAFSDDNAFNQYLNSVYYLDRFVENLLAQYKKLGLYDDTIFVFVGDHGEAFGEHGRYHHDNVIYEEGIHIPLIIYDPQNPQEQRVKEAVTQIDIVPTLLDMLDYNITGGALPGLVMTDVPEERRVYSHCWFEKRCMASISKSNKFIHHFYTQPDEFFDLSVDSLETNNIASANSEPQKLYASELQTWRSDIIRMHQRRDEANLELFVFAAKPEIDHSLDATFGDYVRLVGYTLPQKEVRPGELFRISYVFETLKNLPSGTKLFVHAVADNGRTLNLDHVPARGLYPTAEWKPGQFVVDDHDISVPLDLKSKALKITLGFYHPDKGRASVKGSIIVDKEGRAEVIDIPIIQ